MLLSIPLDPLGHAHEPEKTHVIPGDSCYAYLRSVKGRKKCECGSSVEGQRLALVESVL